MNTNQHKLLLAYKALKIALIQLKESFELPLSTEQQELLSATEALLYHTAPQSNQTQKSNKKKLHDVEISGLPTAVVCQKTGAIVGNFPIWGSHQN